MCHSPFIRMCVCRTTSSPSHEKDMRRCLPRASTPETVRPRIARSAAGEISGELVRKPVTTRPASATRSACAVFQIVSPSGTTKESARVLDEPGLAQRIREGARADGAAVHLLDEQGAPGAGPRLRGERFRERGATPARVLVIVDEGHE